MQQNTQEWLEFRKGKITASKIPVIMGKSPYQTALELYEEEIGQTSPKDATFHMREGNRIEDEARSYFKQVMHITLTPQTLVHPENPLFMASLDGIDDCGSVICEIKRNNVDRHDKTRIGEIEEFHQLQMQWQMYIAREIQRSRGESLLTECFYLSVGKDDTNILRLAYDQTIVEKMVDAGNSFLRCLETRTPPAFSGGDYLNVFDSDIDRLIEDYKYHTECAKAWTVKAEDYKKLIISKLDGRNAKGSSWKLSKFQTKGSIAYDKIPELKNVDLEAYRKAASISYRITIGKDFT